MILMDREPDSKGVYRLLSDQEGMDGMSELKHFLVKSKVKALKVNDRGDATAVVGKEADKARCAGTTWTGRAVIDAIVKHRKERH